MTSTVWAAVSKLKTPESLFRSLSEIKLVGSSCAPKYGGSPVVSHAPTESSLLTYKYKSVMVFPQLAIEDNREKRIVLYKRSRKPTDNLPPLRRDDIRFVLYLLPDKHFEKFAP